MFTSTFEDAEAGSLNGRSPSAAEISSQLDRILSSPHFKNSKRHRRFLGFLVEKYLHGEAGEIKERLIGIHVFDREPSYDVSADPIVRGAAADLRKRLSLYYAEPLHHDELRVEIPLGNYVPRFSWPDGEVHPLFREDHALGSATSEFEERSAPLVLESPGARSERAAILRKRVWIGAFVVLAAVCSIVVYHWQTSGRAMNNVDKFWAPVTNGPGNVLLCPGTLNHLMLQPQVPNDSWNHVTLTRNHLDQNVGLAIMLVSHYLGEKRKGVSLRLPDDASLEDLRAQPVVFLGATSNEWTDRILTGMRFQFKMTKSSGRAIVDTQKGDQPVGTFDASLPVGAITHGYSLITRRKDPLTGQNIISLAGLGSYGTSSAAEFATSAEAIEDFTRHAPKDWSRHDVQILTETDVVNGKNSPAKVIAVDFR